MMHMRTILHDFPFQDSGVFENGEARGYEVLVARQSKSQHDLGVAQFRFTFGKCTGRSV
jgi:hypothetical protein